MQVKKKTFVSKKNRQILDKKISSNLCENNSFEHEMFALVVSIIVYFQIIHRAKHNPSNVVSQLALFSIIIWIVLLFVITLLASEVRRKRLTYINLDDILPGDILYFSTRRNGLDPSRQLLPMAIRILGKSEFDHIGLVVRIKNDLMIMEGGGFHPKSWTRLNIHFRPLHERLEKFDGYICVRRRRQALDEKQSARLTKACLKEYKSIEKHTRKTNAMTFFQRYIQCVLNSTIPVSPWITCADLIHDCLKAAQVPAPFLFMKSQDNKCVEYHDTEHIRLKSHSFVES